MKNFLYLNPDASRPQCAVYQAGKIYADAMKLCKEIYIDYCDVPTDRDLDWKQYEGIIHNYQHVTCQFMDTSVYKLPFIGMGFLYEARFDPRESPSHTGLPMDKMFDKLITPDPTYVSSRNVWGVPRVIPRHIPKPHKQTEWTISTYGFPSPWKDLKTVVQMMNDEFQGAVFRMNFAHASHQEGSQLEAQWPEICEELKLLVRNGNRVEFTQHYFTDSQLVNWLAESDVNVFLASPERGRITGGALLASTDLAIAAQKPIMVSDTIEARHLSPLKFKSLREAMKGGDAVQEFYRQWTPENFANQLDSLVREYL